MFFRKNSIANKLCRLTQDIGKKFKGTVTIFFVDYNNISSEHQKNITYNRIVADYRPQKEDPNHTRLTVGGNFIEYCGDMITPTNYTTTVKIVWNCVVSNTKAKYMYISINVFYLGMPLTRYEYLFISKTLIT